jgi:hypothetical protein
MSSTLILTQGTFRSAGEANLAANAGGTGLFKDKTGVTLNFKGLNVTGGLLTSTPQTNTVDLGLTSGTPVASKTNSTNAPGSGAAVALANHVHAIEVEKQETVSNSATLPFSGTSYTNLMSLTPGAGTYLVLAGATIDGNGSAAEDVAIAIFENGVQKIGSERESNFPLVGGGSGPGFLQTHAVVTVAGGENVDLRWKTAAGNSVIGKERSLTLIQLKA